MDDSGRLFGRGRGDEDRLRVRDGVEFGWEELEDVWYLGKSCSGRFVEDGWEDVVGGGRFGRSKRLDEGRVFGKVG